MAYEDLGKRITGKVAANENANQYHFFTRTANDNYDLTGAGLRADVVLQDNPNTTGFVGEFAVDGVSKMVCGGTVTDGDLIESDSTGRGITRSSGVILGRALASGVVGDIIPCLLKFL